MAKDNLKGMPKSVSLKNKRLCTISVTKKVTETLTCSLHSTIYKLVKLFHEVANIHDADDVEPYASWEVWGATLGEIDGAWFLVSICAPKPEELKQLAQLARTTGYWVLSGRSRCGPPEDGYIQDPDEADALLRGKWKDNPFVLIPLKRWQELYRAFDEATGWDLSCDDNEGCGYDIIEVTPVGRSRSLKKAVMRAEKELTRQGHTILRKCELHSPGIYRCKDCTDLKEKTS